MMSPQPTTDGAAERLLTPSWPPYSDRRLGERKDDRISSVRASNRPQSRKNPDDPGGGIVVGVGREPRPRAAPDGPSLIFDWTALEVAAERQKRQTSSGPRVRPAHCSRLVREGRVGDPG